MRGPVSAAVDLIDFGLFRNAIFTIADEMAVTIFRTAYSGVLKSGMDYSTALADHAGEEDLSARELDTTSVAAIISSKAAIGMR